MDTGLTKNVIIARSGCYEYGINELPKLNLSYESIPEGYRNRQTITVYTPSVTLIEAKELFERLPLTKEHPPVPVTPDNYSLYAKGWSGDSCEIVNVGNEVGIQSTCNLIDRDVLDYYDNDFRDVSPGYFAEYEWRDGVSPDGEEYQIVKTKILAVNHLAFTQSGRGGPEISMDSNYASLEYYSVRMTTDSNTPTFREVVEDIVEFKDEYNPDEIKAGLDAATALINAMPDSKEKAILTRVMKDFDNVKNYTSDSAKLAASTLADLFEELDKKIMEESTVLFGKKKKEATTDAEPPKPDEPPVDTSAEPAASDTPEEVVPPNEPATPPAEAPGPGVTPPDAPAAPVAAVAPAVMEVAQMPDDLSAIDDATLLAVLNGIVKCLKALEAVEPVAPVAEASVEPVTPDSDMPMEAEMETEDAGMDLEEKKDYTGDSIFTMHMGDSKNKVTKSLSDFTKENFGKGRK